MVAIAEIAQTLARTQWVGRLLLGFVAMCAIVGIVVYRKMLPALSAVRTAVCAALRLLVKWRYRVLSALLVVLCLVEASKVAGLARLLFAAILRYSTEMRDWIGSAGTAARFQGPNFIGTAGLVAAAIVQIGQIGATAFGPLAPYYWQPLFEPFARPETRATLNATLAFPYALVKPLAAIEIFNQIHNGWTGVFDAVAANLVDASNQRLRDITGLPLPAPEWPRTGLATLLISAPLNITTRCVRCVADGISRIQIFNWIAGRRTHVAPLCDALVDDLRATVDRGVALHGEINRILDVMSTNAKFAWTGVDCRSQAAPAARAAAGAQNK